MNILKVESIFKKKYKRYMYVNRECIEFSKHFVIFNKLLKLIKIFIDLKLLMANLAT